MRQRWPAPARWEYYEQAGPNKPQHRRELDEWIPIPTSPRVLTITIGPDGGRVVFGDDPAAPPIDPEGPTTDPETGPIEPRPDPPAVLDWQKMGDHVERLQYAIETDDYELATQHSGAIVRLLKKGMA